MSLLERWLAREVEGYALIAGVGLLVMIAMLTSCAGIWLEVLN